MPFLPHRAPVTTDGPTAHVQHGLAHARTHLSVAHMQHIAGKAACGVHLHHDADRVPLAGVPHGERCRGCWEVTR